jgi:hypothetical protein
MTGKNRNHDLQMRYVTVGLFHSLPFWDIPACFKNMLAMRAIAMVISGCRLSLNVIRWKLLNLLKRSCIHGISVISQMHAYEKNKYYFCILRPAVYLVATEHHHATGGDGDSDEVRQICIHRLAGGTGHGNHLKTTEATSKDNCILWPTTDDDGVGDGPTPDPRVGGSHVRLKVSQ